MVSSVSGQAAYAQMSTAGTQATAQPSLTQQLQKAGSQGSGSSIQDTVSISHEAKAALQEASETRQQTMQEANKGDMQAQRLIKREEAETNSSDGQ